VTNKQFRVIWYLSAAVLLLGIVVGALIGITFIRWLAADLLVLIGGGVLWLLWEARGYPSERERDAGTYADHFIYVNEDGTARDLTVDERTISTLGFTRRTVRGLILRAATDSLRLTGRSAAIY
jgi:hypothetical protein